MSLAPDPVLRVFAFLWCDKSLCEESVKSRRDASIAGQDTSAVDP